MSGPVVSAELYAASTDALQRQSFEKAERAMRSTQSAFAVELEESMRSAYLAGLRDGFAQGVASAHHGVTA